MRSQRKLDHLKITRLGTRSPYRAAQSPAKMDASACEVLWSSGSTNVYAVSSIESIYICFCLQESGWMLYHFLENCCSNKIPPRWTVLPHAFFKTQLIWFVRLPMGPGSHYPTVTRSDCTQKLATLRPLDPFCFLSFLVCWWEQSKRNGGEISGRGDVMWFMWFMTPQLGGYPF